MVELDEATRRALLAREGPPASARADILASLRARLGDPGGPDDPGDPGDGGELGELGELAGQAVDAGAATAGQIGWAAKVVGATLGLTGAGLLAVKLGAVAVGSLSSTPAPVEQRSEAPARAVEPTPTAEPDASPEPATPAPVASVEPIPPARSAAPREKTPAASESTLAAELELVAAAKRLRADDPEAALAKLELHAQRFAAGSLAPERDCLRVELLCALDRRSDHAAARSQFLRRYPDSPLRARVLAACQQIGTDPPAAGD